MDRMRARPSRASVSRHSFLRKPARLLLAISIAAMVLVPGAAPLPLPSIAHGAWTVAFDPLSSTLECQHARHQDSRLQVASRSPYCAPAQPRLWSIQAARDSVSGRLAIVDPQKRCPGVCDDTRQRRPALSSVLPRPRNIYAGETPLQPPDRFLARKRSPAAHGCLSRAW